MRLPDDKPIPQEAFPMKRFALLLALFCAGLLTAAFAFADNGKGKDKKCHNVSLKGTAAAQTLTVTVEKSNKAGRELKGKPVTLKFQGKVNVNAVMCADTSTGAAAGASTFQLRNLKVAKPTATTTTTG
jgi:hypothetical protein